MTVIRVKIDRSGIGNLLRSSEMENFVVSEAERVANAIGGDWTVDGSIQHKNRVIAEATTMDPAAHWSEAESGRIATIVKGLSS